MRKSTRIRGSNHQARARPAEPKQGPGHATEEECCALLRGHPIAASTSVPRGPRAHDNGEDRRT